MAGLSGPLRWAVVIVDLDNGSAGLFASSVPGNSPQYDEPAQQAMEGLRVS